MKIGFQFSNLRRVRVHEYLVRFILGGLVTVATGVVAHALGPQTGGMFLAYPAILPASLTLIEKHETEKKKKHGISGAARGRQAAALDASGAALGSIGLGAFALVGRFLLANHEPVLVLGLATLVWFGVSLLALGARRRT
jgi:hypothetical protein